MRRALLASWLGLAACDDPTITIVTPDMSTSCLARSSCNPLTQTGCQSGQKCTWRDDGDDCTVTSCAFEGSGDIGDACSFNALAVDDCLRGAFCFDGECRQICDLNGGVPLCDEPVRTCTRHEGIFISDGHAIAGLCDPRPVDPHPNR